MHVENHDFVCSTMHARGLRRINIFFGGERAGASVSWGKRVDDNFAKSHILLCITGCASYSIKNDVLEGPESFLNIGKLIFSPNGF